jgi:hypothetical protein
MVNEGKSAVGATLLHPVPRDVGQAGLGTTVLMLPLAALHSSAAMLIDVSAMLLPSPMLAHVSCSGQRIQPILILFDRWQRAAHLFPDQHMEEAAAQEQHMVMPHAPAATHAVPRLGCTSPVSIHGGSEVKA